MDVIKLVEDRINNTKVSGKFAEESKKKLIEYYCITNKSKLEVVPLDKIENHDFQWEIKTGALRLKKQVELRKIVTKFEAHKYAPELNCLHFKSGKTYKVHSFVDTMEEAILYASIHMDEREIELYKNDYLKHFRN